MSKAFLDTTILADVLLKTGPRKAKALAALRRYDSAEAPVYAIKEFKAGALYSWVWLHNKLKSTGSFAQTLAAIQAVMAHKKNLPATAMEALAQLARQHNSTFGALAQKYGKNADEDAVAADRYRFEARRRIATAWRKRRSLATMVVPLSCYTEQEPYEGPDGLLACNPTGCDGAEECCMAPILRAKNEHLVALRNVVLKQEAKPENSRRSHALKELIKKRRLTDQMCRSLGDVIFAFFAPGDSVILTTNDRDHRPLAEALGKRVDTP